MTDGLVGGPTGRATWLSRLSVMERVTGVGSGPLLLCIGGLHGNEPAGVRALEAIVEAVAARRRLLRGEFIAVAGNLQALAAGRRFLAYDLNRAWTPAGVAAVRSLDAANGSAVEPEDVEMLRILDVLDEVAARRRGPVYVLDIHTTSGGGGAFTTASDLSHNKRFAMAIPAPLVIKLDQHLEGTFNSYMDHLGYTAAVFECGQHEEAESRVRAASAVWLAIHAAGLLDWGDAPEAAAAYRALRQAYRGLPRVLESTYRHPIEPADRYRTRLGFRNFQRVRAGDIVGDDRRGEVAVPKSGRLLMPLYQEQGEDGFFIVREVAGITSGKAVGAPAEAAPPHG
ncbi:MAG: succinylglutamate desuccinylase/aspartoacylase family protein [Gemmatimonadota bacterium]|nr:succinylglutamate desuccinylase/aspartoacylase family protein [Gemmatimonadota bacterium]